MSQRRTLLLFIWAFAQMPGTAVEPLRIGIDAATELRWPTEPTGTYQLEWSPQPTGPWSVLGDPVAGDGHEHTAFVPGSSSQHYYRVIESKPGVPAVPPLPVNGGFESGSGALPDSWTTSANHSPVRTQEDANSGDYCLKASVNSGGQEGLIHQRIGQAGERVSSASTYHFSFWAKSIELGPSFVQQYEVQWLNQSGQTVGGTGLKNFNPGSSSWSKIASERLTPPSTATDARITFRFATGTVPGARGTVLIDDVVLDDGSETAVAPEITTLPVAITPASRISWQSEFGVPYQASATTDFDQWLGFGPELQGDGGLMELYVAQERDFEFYRLSYPGAPDNPDPSGPVVALFNAGTGLEPPTTIDSPQALITRVADRARDRHAREAVFNSYDHYLSWYWEQRVANIEIIDRVAKGGTTVTFNYTTHDRLNPAEFRAFFGGLNTPAQYNLNTIAPLISTSPSSTPGETDYLYSAVIDRNANEGNRPLQVGDRIEVEISQFLNAPRNGRNNYYGTTILYIVGQGIVPWAQGNDLGFPGGIVGGVNRDLDSHPLPESAWLGGQTSLPYQYSNEPEHRFKQTAGNLSPTNGGPFMLGRRLHHTDFGSGAHSEGGNPIFSAHVGKLGPSYIAASCVECHVNNGRALPPTIDAPMFQSVVKVGRDGAGSPHPTLGSVLQPRSTGETAETIATIAEYITSDGQYGDGSSFTLRKPIYAFEGEVPDYFSVRLAPPLVGLGLLEAIDERSILAMADPDDEDGDGISGRYQTVTDPETGELRLGRFTTKAAQARLSHQIASALNTDMGVTTSVFPLLDGETGTGTEELGDSELDQLTRYVALLGVASQRNLDDAEVIRGKQLFAAANCVACHTPELTTSAYHPMAELRNQTIRPYTDLLLHDMGPALADNMGEDGASGSEWRTPPLWGIGLTAGVSGGEAYLHDGRARSLEEAILWHGGEAQASKEAFRTMPAADREALIEFLKSL